MPDTDNNGAISPIVDALFILNFMFLNGPDPDPPYPDCGTIDAGDAFFKRWGRILLRHLVNHASAFSPCTQHAME